MANTLVETQADQLPPEPAPALSADLRRLLRPLASLKLTIVLLAMAILVVLAGTGAQANKDVWEAVGQYFRSFGVLVELKDLVRVVFIQADVPGVIPFPGGWAIGAVMMVNLLAAHLVRFKVQVHGSRLMVGLAVIAAGIVVTALVIGSGSSKEGFQHATWIEWPKLWVALKSALVVAWLGTLYGWTRLLRAPETERWVLVLSGLVCALLGILSGWLIFQGKAATLGDSSMRILWQLIKATFAGVVMLIGCILAFRKRAGIVLLHSGVALMMFSEVIVGLWAVEGQMHIREGQTVNYTQDLRRIELAFVDSSDPKEDDMIVVPQSVLLGGGTIKHDLLPCDLEVVRFLKNSTVRASRPGDDNPATAGIGRSAVAEPVRAGTGTDAGGQVDMASAYVKLSGKGAAEAAGTYLFSRGLKPEPIELDGKTYNVSLRFKHTYKPYAVTLVDVRKEDYIGTNTPRDYSSNIRLVDQTRKVDRDIRIWMNNPLRFAGETFYQSSYDRDPNTGVEMTGLQVVTNTGWMIPYVACMIVAVGMLFHFAVILLRFLNRRTTEVAQGAPVAAPPEPQPARIGPAIKGRKARKLDLEPAHWPAGPQTSLAGTIVPLLSVAVFAMWLVGQVRPPRNAAEELQIHQFGKLPVVFEGRVKPFDTLARTSLRVISDKQTFRDEDENRQPAIRWLLDVIAETDAARKHKVFRIENTEVLDTLGLEPRKGYRYSVEEISKRILEFEKQVQHAHAVPVKELSVYERKLIELQRRLQAYMLLVRSFQPPPLPPIPSEEEMKNDSEAAKAKLDQLRHALVEGPRQLAAMQPPLAVPIKSAKPGEKAWLPFTSAWADAFIQSRIMGKEIEPATESFTEILAAYGNNNPKKFNAEVAKYQAALQTDPPEGYNAAKVSFETFFNHLAGFFYASWWYFLAFVLAVLGWLGFSRPLHRASFWLIVVTLALHTFSLIGRIYISGRPPVTNLYSSAVFVGWGCVAIGLVLEMIYRIGIGNALAGITGFATLLVAHLLTTEVPTFRSDTFTVMQAVLDTQFWLATHVVCISLGYTTTFVAGFLGLLYAVLGLATPLLTPKVGRDLARMIYGTLCFALFFSFVGTVLGGLWADDSWGRFWGWDPKENGALIIVLWNALVLHARWDGIVRDRGMAVLAMVGNIVTSWSWFGVNEMGVGLHSYGFTEGVKPVLIGFIMLQLFIVAVGSLPKDLWRSYRARPTP